MPFEIPLTHACDTMQGMHTARFEDTMQSLRAAHVGYTMHRMHAADPSALNLFDLFFDQVVQ